MLPLVFAILLIILAVLHLTKKNFIQAAIYACAGMAIVGITFDSIHLKGIFGNLTIGCILFGICHTVRRMSIGKDRRKREDFNRVQKRKQKQVELRT